MSSGYITFRHNNLFYTFETEPDSELETVGAEIVNDLLSYDKTKYGYLKNLLSNMKEKYDESEFSNVDPDEIDGFLMDFIYEYPRVHFYSSVSKNPPLSFVHAIYYYCIDLDNNKLNIKYSICEKECNRCMKVEKSFSLDCIPVNWMEICQERERRVLFIMKETNLDVSF